MILNYRSEAEFDDLSEYRTISHFFRRRLKPGCRPIADSDLISPADGAVTYAGPVQGFHLHQVKGVKYDLRQFIGPLETIDSEVVINIEQYWSLLSLNESLHSTISDNSKFGSLNQVVVYLSPADYHRFHSPVTWTVFKRRHFPGKLYSVTPSLVRKWPGLFHTNERVAFIGRWKYGLFALVAVGATNVGSIVVHFDRELRTNRRDKNSTEKIYEHPLEFQKGAEFGYFNFGSTVVLIFEGPKNIKFETREMRKIRMGETIHKDL